MRELVCQDVANPVRLRTAQVEVVRDTCRPEVDRIRCRVEGAAVGVVDVATQYPWLALGTELVKIGYRCIYLLGDRRNSLRERLETRVISDLEVLGFDVEPL